MKKLEKMTFRELFLRNFVESLIETIKPLPSIKKENSTEYFVGKKEEIVGQYIPSERTVIIEPNAPNAPTQKIELKTLQPTSKKVIPVHGMKVRNPQNVFNKIIPLINNPSIISIESPGPNKNIIINKLGTIEVIPVILTKTEIDIILNDVSQKTRIPLNKGIFKVALGNLTITAVISDLVGSRFHMEKVARKF
jgi:hypothetical protein